jgi:hypothetical protein
MATVSLADAGIRRAFLYLAVELNRVGGNALPGSQSPLISQADLT